MDNEKVKKTLTNIIKVSASNIVRMISGVLVGLLLPKIIGVEDYGYYKTFTLYISYVGLFHLGFSDGIYLKYGGKNYDELDKVSFRLYSSFFLGLETFFSLLIILVSILFLKYDYLFIFISVALYMFFNNVTSYFQMLSQITGRFNELSSRNLIQSIVTSSIIFVLLFVKIVLKIDITYRLYIVLYLVSIILLAIWYMNTYKEIVVGESSSYLEKKDIIKGFIIAGSPLMVSNLCSTLLLTLDRQFVNILFDNGTYAIYAFAYNLLSLITTALTAISTVLYPTMKRMNTELIKNSYEKLIACILMIVGFCIGVYFPLHIFINWFLPKYEASLLIFRVILPSLIFSSAITLVMHNYYKFLNKNTIFFKKTIYILLLSAVANYVFYYIFKTPISISIASVIVMVIWYILMEKDIIIEYNISWKRNFIYSIIVSVVFYFSSFLSNQILGFVVYYLLFIITTCLIFRHEIKNIISIIQKK